MSLQKRVYKDFKVNNLLNYHDLYIQSDTLLSDYLFENFCSKCLEISEPDAVHFFINKRITMACISKTEKK